MNRPSAQTGRVLALAATTSIIALWAAPAAAQATWNPAPPPQQQADQESADARSSFLNFGVPLPKTFEITVMGRAAYDSNVSRGDTLVSDIRDLRKGDFIYTPSVSVSLAQPLGRQAVYLDGSIGYDFYQYNTNLNSSRIGLTGGFQGRMGRCGAGLNGGFSQHQSDQGDLPLTTTENKQTNENVGIQLNCSTSRGLGASLSTQYSTLNNSSDGLIDSDTVSVTAGLNYTRPRLGIVSTFFEYTTTNYSEDGLQPFQVPSEYQSYDIGLRIERPITHRLKGVAQISYQIVPAQSGGAGRYTGLSGNADLNYRVNTRLNLDLSYDRTIAPTIQPGSAYELIESVQLQGNYTLSSRLKASLGARWGQTDYKSDPAFFIPNQLSDDEIWSLYTALSLSIGRTASLSLDARRDVRNTNLTVFNYTAYRVGVTATKTF